MSHALSPSRPRAARAGLLASAAALVALTLGAAPATAAVDSAVQWSAVPADAAGPDGRISLRHVAEPGTTVTDAIAVTNLGAQDAAFAVAAGDGRLGENGAFDIAAGEPRDAGAWITVDGLDAGSIAVPAGQTRVLPLSIAVPADATPGDHPAGIVVALSREEDGVTVTNRVGVRVHLQVAGDIVSQLDITGVETSFAASWVPFAPGALRVRMQVENTGNVRVGAVGGAGAFGATAEPAAAAPIELLPGDTGTVEVELAAWPILLLFGDARVSTVAIGEDALPVSEAVAESFTAAAVPWSGLALLVLVAGVVVGVVLVRRRTRPAAASASESEETRT